MIKLYRTIEGKKEYWETWEHEGTHTIHYGVLGTKGKTETIKKGGSEAVETKVAEMIDQGYAPIELDDHAMIIIEYPIGDVPSNDDLDKRYALEDRMNETLGWTGLGACDGGSIGSGTMEVFNFVVDFDVAKSVVEADLAGSEFADYSRIYSGE